MIDDVGVLAGPIKALVSGDFGVSVDPAEVNDVLTLCKIHDPVAGSDAFARVVEDERVRTQSSRQDVGSSTSDDLIVTRASIDLVIAIRAEESFMSGGTGHGVSA